jgi:SPP1 gp7 family putative phage head morphogenesis protein
VEIHLSRFVRELRSIMERLVTDPASVFVANYAEQSYRKGVLFSKMSLDRIGFKAAVEASGQMLPVDWRAIDSLGVRNLSALKGITDETSKAIVQEVSTGMQKGEGVDRIAKRIRDRVDNIGRARSMVMARTETSFAFNDAALIRYRQYGITSVEWLTGQDEKVCEICGPRHGRVYPIDQVPECPAHPNCRCTLLAARDDREVS